MSNQTATSDGGSKNQADQASKNLNRFSAFVKSGAEEFVVQNAASKKYVDDAQKIYVEVIFFFFF